MRYIGQDEDGHGTVDFKVRFHDGQLDLGTGGHHFFNVTSRPLAFTPPEYGLSTWTRIDFDDPGTGRLRVVIFNNVNGAQLNNGFWPNHVFPIPFDEDVWVDVHIEWRQVNDRLTVTLNGNSHTFDLLPGSENVGNYIAFGNIYEIQGEIEVDEVRWQQ